MHMHIYAYTPQNSHANLYKIFLVSSLVAPHKPVRLSLLDILKWWRKDDDPPYFILMLFQFCSNQFQEVFPSSVKNHRCHECKRTYFQDVSPSLLKITIILPSRYSDNVMPCK